MNQVKAQCYTNPNFDIAVVLPTRGRTDALDVSLMSLVDNCADPKRIQYLLAFDNDDQESIDYFKEHIAPKIEAAGSAWSALAFDPVGYARLNEYINVLASEASANWIFFWNDDALMHSKDWDKTITKETGMFNVLRIPTHNEHPYAIFPIVPRDWYLLFGYLSLHQLSDAWISQIGYMLDIVKNIDIDVTHDRADLTGNNADDTFKERQIFEGNPYDPRDFNHPTYGNKRFDDAMRIYWYLKGKGYNMNFFERVLAGQQDPWTSMNANDPNDQVTTIKIKQQ